MKRLFLVAASAALLTSWLSSSVDAKPIELTYSIFFPPTHKNTLLATEWAKEIEKRTDGKVKITIFSGGTLTPADKCYDGVETGISDLGMSALAYTRGKFPLSEVLDLPLGANSGLATTEMVNAYYKKFEPKEFSGVKILYLHGHGPGILHTKKPVAKIEDLKGMKIRCTGLAAKVVTALGGTAVAMPMGETYDAISRGVVDGSMAPQESLQGWRWGEVVKSTTECLGAAYSTTFFVAMNKTKWESLPKDVQNVIAQVSEEWIARTGKAWDDMDRAGRDFTLARGNQIITLSPEENARWAKAVQPLIEEYLKKMKDKGLPGDEALKTCQEALQKAEAAVKHSAAKPK